MPRHVLLIDDEKAISAALTIRLRAVGYDITSMSDGQSGLVEAAKMRPDVILLDIRMPGMDGYEVCIRLKSAPETSHIPVIFLSANATESTRKQAMEVGGAAFISKPFEAKDVIDAVVSLMDKPGRHERIGSA